MEIYDSFLYFVGHNICNRYIQKLIIRINELEPVFSCLEEFKLCRYYSHFNLYIDNQKEVGIINVQMQPEYMQD